MGLRIAREVHARVCAHCGFDENRLGNLYCVNCGHSLLGCTHCNSVDNQTSNVYCIDCGLPLSVCPLCGNNNRLGNSFCAYCGQVLTRDKTVIRSLEEEAEYSGFWRRVGAYVIDWFILGFIQSPLSFVFFFLPYSYYYDFGSVVNIIYTIGFWGKKSRTPGKMALSITIVTEEGQPISTGRAFIRYFGYIPCFLSLGLGFFWIIWDRNKQGWHDKLANTYVIRV